MEKLQREEADFIKNNETFNHEYVLQEGISTFFPEQIDNIDYQILEKISSIFYFQYNTEESISLDTPPPSTQNLGLPRCISVLLFLLILYIEIFILDQ